MGKDLSYLPGWLKAAQTDKKRSAPSHLAKANGVPLATLDGNPSDSYLIPESCFRLES
jgi:hypothetical protein